MTGSFARTVDNFRSKTESLLWKPYAFVNDSVSRLFDEFFWSVSHRYFLTMLAQVETLEQAVDMAWKYRGWGYYRKIVPSQDRWEIAEAAKRVSDIDPKVIVEIGTRGGGSLFIWIQAARLAELVISIDLPGGIHGGGYPELRSKLYRLFLSSCPGCQMELLRLDSHQKTTRQQLLDILGGRSVDFLFIDGDHRYEGVKTDFNLYRDLVRSGGLICFHDIRPNPRDPTIQVYRLWEEIKKEGYKTEEIINEPYQGRYGIGLYTVQS